MPTTLNIRWDGDVPGISEHQLSLGSWGTSLSYLLKCLRRYASGIIKDAYSEEYGAHGGRLAKRAATMDISIADIGEGSLLLALAFSIAPTHPDNVLQSRLFRDSELIDELPGLAAQRFFSDVEAESKGKPRNQMARRFLGLLPEGLSIQEYTVLRNGDEVHKTLIRDVTLPELDPILPGTKIISAYVVGVEFPPKSDTIYLQEVGSTPVLKVKATSEHVEKALSLRDQEVSALVVTIKGKSRLIWLHSKTRAEPPLSAGQRDVAFGERWGTTLRMLSE